MLKPPQHLAATAAADKYLKLTLICVFPLVFV